MMTFHPHDRLSAYLDDELNDEEKNAIEAHLTQCESCQALLDEWLTMQVQVRDVFQFVQAPVDLDINVMQAIGVESATSSGKGWLTLPLAAVLLLTLFGITTGVMFVKLIHSMARLFVAILYTLTHFMSHIPFVSVSVIVVSLLILSASLFSLRRVLQFTLAERG